MTPPKSFFLARMAETFRELHGIADEALEIIDGADTDELRDYVDCIADAAQDLDHYWGQWYGAGSKQEDR